MTENTNVSQAMEELKGASEEELREVIERWFERTRTSGMKIGASFISAAVYDAIEKNLTKGSNSSLRDYQRAIKRVIEIVSVQLTRQNDSIVTDSNEISEEATND